MEITSEYGGEMDRFFFTSLEVTELIDAEGSELEHITLLICPKCWFLAKYTGCFEQFGILTVPLTTLVTVGH